MSRTLVLAAGLVLAATPLVQGQTVYGSDLVGMLTWETTTTPGGPCAAPVPFLMPCPNAAAVCPGVPPLTPVPAGMLWGDIADNPLTDTVYVTDGRVILEHDGDPACLSAPCTPFTSFIVPPAFGMGPITGMGCDASGVFTGGPPLLWITDGMFIAGIAPPPTGVCGPPAIVFPPCPVPAALAPLTDVSWDPAAGLLWVVSAAGFVQGFAMPGCAPVTPPVPVAGCGLVGPLTGLAVDTATPNFMSPVTAGYVTDGAVIAYIDLFTGLPAPPTFYTPVTCTPAPAPLSGLALAQHGVNYGAPRVTAKIGSYGQSTSPGPTFGLEVSGAPSFGTAFLILNFNFPGPGYFCPAVPGVGTKIWVDPTPPGSVLALPPLGPGCAPIPLPIPAGVPAGLELFAQFVFLAGPPPAIDATGGLAATVALP